MGVAQGREPVRTKGTSRVKHTGKLTPRTLEAIKKDLRAYQASAYPVGKTHVRKLLTGHFGVSEKGANRILSRILGRHL